MNSPTSKPLPFGVAIVAVYLILLGAVQFGALVSPTQPTEPTLGSLVVRGAVTSIVAGLFFVAGFGLFRRKKWSRKLALGALTVAAYGLIKNGMLLYRWSHSVPLVVAAAGSLLGFTLVFFVLLLRRSAVDALS